LIPGQAKATSSHVTDAVKDIMNAAKRIGQRRRINSVGTNLYSSKINFNEPKFLDETAILKAFLWPKNPES